ncbi:tRNA 2'-phosphotransferase 1 [Eurytemora carolleeae]|uniref:tRNA 2'-phosphotransferase 1 n=1 Tax=Eurytemora carolleeae TaxID=1294199 RepID=UPI000C78CCC6|nr:tRNA 2'-phosphotransferase 1 [Eurytemora carolleeae]|eukprot:XP_023331577.1 tRNA 2'-phosphotransferase 1-like [Eurytemora affinis]
MTEISDAEDVPKAIHGTTFKAWQSIRTQGLSRMNRQHIHMSAGEPGDEGVISGMRHQSQIFIYIDVKMCLEAGLKFYRSSNNVILSPGDQEGFIKPQFFAAVKDTKLNKMLL